MLLAADRLSTSRSPIATVAYAVGYESESAFSAAFKRVMKMSLKVLRGNAYSPGDQRESG